MSKYQIVLDVPSLSIVSKVTKETTEIQKHGNIDEKKQQHHNMPC
jgi:hypothetical protein